jgi:hypothetical protein
MSDAVLALVVMATFAAFVIFQFTSQMQTAGVQAHVDWRLVPAGILILFALWILAALALACSTRLDTIPTLAVCSAFFMMGLMSDYLLGQRAEPVWQQDLQVEVGNPRWSDDQKALLKSIVQKYDADNSGKLELSERKAVTAEDKARLQSAGMGGSWWASVLYTVIPNWQLFWFADALDMDKSTFQWGYVGKAFAYMVAYAGAALAIGMVLFEERELS